jgi:DNA-binding NarL/FixJ family response regulator
VVKRNKLQKNNQVLIVDDHPVFLEGFKAIIKRDGRFTIIGCARTGEEGLRLAEALEPDLVVTEIDLPDQYAFQMISKLRNLLPSTPIMILSAHGQIEHVAKALQSGATGYVMKNSDNESILNGMETLLKGNCYLDSTVPPDTVMGFCSFGNGNGRVAININRSLTPREREVMGMLAEGRTRKQIGESLSISPRTVESHATNIMKKLSLNSTVELVRYAVKFGLINVDDWKGESSAMKYPKSFLMRKT